jgi:hypothetical protein
MYGVFYPESKYFTIRFSQQTSNAYYKVPFYFKTVWKIKPGDRKYFSNMR